MKTEMGKADLHLHTNCSDGFNTPQEVVDRALRVGLDIVAVTDHNLFKPSLEAQNYAIKQKLPLKVILGEEISSKDGEIIGLFLKRRIKPFLTAEETIQKIHQQDGLAVIAHPMRIFLGFSLWRRKIEELAEKKLIDGLEIFNFWDHNPWHFSKRSQLAKKWSLAKIGGSDSHSISTLGTIWTSFPGKTEKDLYRAIKSRQTKAVTQANIFLKTKEHLRHTCLRLTRKTGHYENLPSWEKFKHVLKLSL